MDATEVPLVLIFAVTAAVSYLLGSIPFGFLTGKLLGIDVRTQGSGNIGATNVLRTVGKKYGVAVFICDALKGFLPVYLVLCLNLQDRQEQSLLGATAAVAAVVGHTFPVWLGFRGGKGVATAAGAYAALLPLATCVAAAIWLITFFAFRFVSLASLAAVTALPITALFLSLHRRQHDFVFAGFAAVIAVLVIVRHYSNIARLLRGTEPRFR